MTTSYELSLKLKELGVDQEGGEYYYYDVKGQEILLHSLSFMAASFNAICRALTLGELVRELPARVSIDKLKTGFLAYTYDQFGDIGINYYSPTPEEAAGVLLCEILKQKEG